MNIQILLINARLIEVSTATFVGIDAFCYLVGGLGQTLRTCS